MSQMIYSRDLALVGAGYWGKNLARNFNELGTLHTVCDRSPEVLDSYEQGYEHVKKVSSYEQVLADPDVRKVAIAVPAALHYQLAKAALLSGKDVYVEKPLCLDLEQATELAELARKLGQVLMVGHLLRYHPCVKRLHQMVSNGDLGKLHYITSNRLNLGLIRQEENVLWSFAPHDVSVIIALLGDTLPDEVRCTGESYLTAQVADVTLTSLRFSGGVRAHIYVSWLNPFKEQKLTVVGSKGMIVFDDTRPWAEKLTFYGDYLTWANGKAPVASKTKGSFVEVPQAEPLQEECEHFLRCCLTRESPLTDGEEGLRVLKVLKAAQASLELDGKPASPISFSKPRYFSHPTAVVDENAIVGDGCKIWHFSHVMKGAELGPGCNLGQNVVISPKVKLGANVKIQNNVSVYTGTIVEDDVFLGPSCVLTNVTNPRSQIVRHSLYEETRIRRGATIGANATIVCGVILGRYSFIGAGAVVTRDVPDYALVVGNPARQVGWMSRLGHRLSDSDSHGVMRCPESGHRYIIKLVDGEEILRCLDLDEDAPLPDELSLGKQSYKELKK